MSGTKISYVEVSKRYGGVEALRPTSIEIEAGEFFSIIGPSGSGKTTLLGVTAGYNPPTTGSIIVNGRDIVKVPPFRRDIGMVFQNYALFPHMTVAENVSFPLRMRKQSKADISKRVMDMLAMVQLDTMADRKPGQLSGGQQQRVALARAAVYDPVLLLMDEPLSALDKNLRETMQDEIKQFHAALGSTVLYVTHDQAEAAAMSDRIAIMNHGRIEQVGLPRELYEHPVNRFIAGFLGEANIFDLVELTAHGDGSRMRTTQGIELNSATAPAGTGQCACVRPEAMHIATGDVEDDNVIPGVVVDAVYMAGSLRYRIEIAPGFVITKRMPSERGTDMIAIGSSVTLHWRAEDTLLVDDSD